MNRIVRVAALCVALAGCFGELNTAVLDAAPDGPVDATPPLDGAVDVAPPDAPAVDAADEAAVDDASDGAVDDAVDDASDGAMDAMSVDGAMDAMGVDGAMDAAGLDVAPDRLLVDRLVIDVTRDVVDAGDPVDPTLDPPRLVTPLSVSRVTRRVRFGWRNAAGADGAVIDVCRDRACATIEFSAIATGESLTPPSDIATGYRWWRARGRRGNVTGTRTSPVWEFYTPPRRPGVAVPPPRQWATMPDLNGDGLADLLVGAPGNARNGGAYLFPGVGDHFSAAPAVFTAVGGASFGRHVSVLRDVNGDGLVDLAIGGATAVSLYLGSATGAPTLARTLTGPQWLTSAGDVNGDGYGDVLALDGSTVALYLGASDGLAATPARMLSGTGAASVGDLDGDGFDDVAVQVATTRVSVFRGVSTGLATLVAFTLDAPTGRTLTNLSLAGDVNGDGLVDLIATATLIGSTSALPAVFVMNAPGVRTNAALLLTAPAAPRLSNFAASVGAAGDFNGDGVDDMIVGSNNSVLLGSSVACVYAGSVTGPATAPTQCITVTLPTRFGAAVGGTGDLNGDGLEDLVVGAPGTTARGEVTVYRGRAAGLSEMPPTLSDGDLTGGFGSDLAGLR